MIQLIIIWIILGDLQILIKVLFELGVFIQNEYMILILKLFLLIVYFDIMMFFNYLFNVGNILLYIGVLNEKFRY